MADVGEIGKGFLDEKGRVKSKEELEKELKATANPNQSRNISTQEAASKQSLSDEARSAFGSVKARFNQDASEIASVINENKETLNQSEELVKQQIAAAKDLKAAIKSEDSEKASEARQKLSDLSERRDEFAIKIGRQNQEKAPDSVRTLNLGNEKKGSFAIDAIEFEGSSGGVDLETTAGINAFINDLQADKDSINSQQEKLQGTREELRGVTKETREQLNQIEGSTLKSLEDAERSAQNIAGRLKAGGLETALSTISTKVNEAAVKSLLQ